MASNYWSTFLSFWQKRSVRERVLLAGIGVFLLAGVVIPTIVAPITEAFSAQSRELTEIRNTFASTPAVLSRYANLVRRKKDVEAFYANANLSETPLAYLESLFKEKLHLQAGQYSFLPTANKESSPTGGKYVHKFFSFRFTTSNYEYLTDFLKALTSGKQPMLVSQITVEKHAGREDLEVKLEVSGFEVKNK